MNSPQADTRGNAAIGAFAANGSRPAQNNYLLDGIDNNSDTVDFLNGTNFVVLPPVDAIQEFKVQTTNFSAEFGRSGAAVLNATIKSGTNALHGAGWEFFRNDKLDAADYFERNVASDGTTTTRKGQLNLNQFGVAIGGPVIKNKIFIFGDYEGLRRRQGSPHTGSVPTSSGAEQRLHQLHGVDYGTIGHTNGPVGPDDAHWDDPGSCNHACCCGRICPRSIRLPARPATANFTLAGLQPEHSAGWAVGCECHQVVESVSAPDQRRAYRPTSLLRRRSAKIATPLTPGWTSTSATRTRSSTASAMWMIRNLSPASSGAWLMAAASRKVLRPHWRSRAHWPGPMCFRRHGQRRASGT